MNEERFRTNVFVGSLLLALSLCVGLFWPFWRSIAWAVVLAILIYPIHRRIVVRFGNVTVGAAVSTLLTITLIVLPLLVVLVAVTAEGIGMVALTRDMIERGDWQKYAPNLQTGPIADLVALLRRYHIDTSQMGPDDIANQLLGRLSDFLAKNAVPFVQNLVKNVAASVVQIGLTLVTLFFILKDGSKVLPAVKAFIPLDKEQTDTVLTKAVETMYATFYGVVLVAMLQGTLGGIAFWFLGLPSPLLWGVVMSALCVIPLAGAPIVWVPAVLILVTQGLYTKAIILTLWGWLVVGLVDNFTRPFIIGGRTSLHPLAVFFSILGGLLTVGSVGVFLGPVLLSVTLALLDILRIKISSAPRDVPPPPPGPPAGIDIQEKVAPEAVPETPTDAIPPTGGTPRPQKPRVVI